MCLQGVNFVSEPLDGNFLVKIYYYCLCIGDDLITPVYVPPTRPPTTTPKVTPSSQCDDEDCVTGSGSGEVTTEDNSTGIAGKGKLNCIRPAQCEERTELCMILREITHWYGMQQHSIFIGVIVAGM
jgi:hypothetical protein